MSQRRPTNEVDQSLPRSGGDSEPLQPVGGDTALIRWIAEGSAPALGAFYDRWADRVYTMVLRVVKDTDIAEQIVEATFWDAWKTASEFDSARTTVADWMLMISRRKTVEQLRARRVAQQPATCSTGEITEAPDPNNTSARIVQLAIPQAGICERLRKAVEVAALKDAESVDVLRKAVCDFTASLRDEGIQPEGVLISLKTMIQNRSIPPGIPASTDWNGSELREKVSTWSIEEFFRGRADYSLLNPLSRPHLSAPS